MSVDAGGGKLKSFKMPKAIKTVNKQAHQFFKSRKYRDELVKKASRMKKKLRNYKAERMSVDAGGGKLKSFKMSKAIKTVNKQAHQFF